MDGSVTKTDRLDPLKFTDVANSAISLAHKVRDQIRSLTRDIAFPHGKSIARVTSRAPVAVKAEEQIATEGDAEVLSRLQRIEAAEKGEKGEEEEEE